MYETILHISKIITSIIVIFNIVLICICILSLILYMIYHSCKYVYPITYRKKLT